MPETISAEMPTDDNELNNLREKVAKLEAAKANQRQENNQNPLADVLGVAQAVVQMGGVKALWEGSAPVRTPVRKKGDGTVLGFGKQYVQDLQDNTANHVTTGVLSATLTIGGLATTGRGVLGKSAQQFTSKLIMGK